MSLERASKIPQRNFQNSCAALRNKMEFMRSMIEKKPPEWKVATIQQLCLAAEIRTVFEILKCYNDFCVHC